MKNYAHEKKTKIVKRKNVEKKKKITVNIHINFSHKFIFP